MPAGEVRLSDVRLRRVCARVACQGKGCGNVCRAGYGWERCCMEYGRVGRDVVMLGKDVAVLTREEGALIGDEMG